MQKLGEATVFTILFAENSGCILEPRDKVRTIGLHNAVILVFHSTRGNFYERCEIKITQFFGARFNIAGRF